MILNILFTLNNINPLIRQLVFVHSFNCKKKPHCYNLIDRVVRQRHLFAWNQVLTRFSRCNQYSCSIVQGPDQAAPNDNTPVHVYVGMDIFLCDDKIRLVPTNSAGSIPELEICDKKSI